MALFEGHIAAVTGAGSGIGKAVALNLARQGAHVCLLGRTDGKLRAVAEAINSKGMNASCYPVDLCDDAGLRECAAALCTDLGRLNILVHSAGMYARGPLSSASITDFDTLFQINVRGPYLLTQLLLPAILSCRGQIAFVNSTAGLRATAFNGQYAATKHALKAVADSLRAEVGERGVRVMSVYPGRTATPMQNQVLRLEGRACPVELLMQPGDVAEAVVSSLSMPHRAHVTDIQIWPTARV
ncbi:MAG: SDR family NAD(P)-dependent oxidoreductase [Chitinivibrionales bacterium]|nr:SDR family NAD(P)-dependent oxidoreductase [Chitinivibrionales bacterium]